MVIVHSSLPKGICTQRMGTEKVRFPSIPLTFVPSGRFPRARLQPIELRRVRFAVFLCSLQKLRHSCPVLPTLALLLAKAVLRNGSSCGVFSSRCSRWSRRSSLQSTSSYYKKNFFSGFSQSAKAFRDERITGLLI